MAVTHLSQKQLNFARLSTVCVDIIKLPLIDILNIYIKPSDLDKHIKGCRSLLTGEYRLNPDQQRKCCYNSSNVPDYSEFDVTLLYKLIRNLCPSLEPTNKWGNKPTEYNLCVGDDIERIRILRNKYFAHSALAEISDDEFKELWNDATRIIQRCQHFTTSNGCQSDYNQMLKDLGRNNLTFNEYTSLKERSGAIYILGDTEVLCGKTACFKAEITLEQDVFLPVSWDKVDGLVRKQIDIASDKYRGSNSRQLLIHSVCKDDEAGYQAVISRTQDVRILSNNVDLRAMGEPPCLEELNVSTKKGDIYIHYVFKVLENSPIVQDVRWTKDSLTQVLPNDKYRGGGLADNCIKILGPCEEDKGLYICTVSNAVGSVSKSVKLDIPSVEIRSTTNLKVIFGSDTRFDCNVYGYPSPDKVKWQNSIDGTKFYPIDTDLDKYFGSSSGPSSPFLLVWNTSFKDQQYYRIVVSNAIGECISKTLFLRVTGNRPNISEGTCTSLDHSVKLKCDIFLYDESPAVNDVYWTKNGIKISFSTSDGKYAGVNINNPSLTINNVDCNDAGKYQLTAVNAVGETKSETIVLGVPAVYLKEYVKKEDGSLCVTMTIKSVPVPRFVQWSIKENNSETCQPINVNAEEYTGSSNIFPYPVLVLKHVDILDVCSFEIEVKNQIGEVKARVAEIMKRDQNTVGKFYTDSGSRLPFGKLFVKLAENFPTDKIDLLKHLIHFSCNIEDVTELERAKSAGDCFKVLWREGIFTPSDVIAMQFLLQETKCEELDNECINYAKKYNALYYYETPSENGYQNVRFHVVANLHNFTVEEETKIRQTVASIVGCCIEQIRVHGYLRSTSFFIVLSIKTSYIERLLAMKQCDKDRLSKLHIDYFMVDFNTISLGRTTDFSKEEHKTESPIKINQSQPRIPDFGERPSYKDPLLKSVADLNYILDIMKNKIHPKESQIEELIKQIKICLHDLELEMKKSDRFQKPLPKTEIIIIEIDCIKMKMNKVPLKHKQILTDITEVLNRLQETLRDTKENAIFIEIDGRLSKSNIDNLSSCTWDNRDGEEALPELNQFQTMESNVYCFETTNDEHRSKWCAKQEQGQPIDFYVAINAVNQTEDKIIQAYVLHVNEGDWKLYDTHQKGKYVVFRSEKVDAFFIMGTFIRRDFVVNPSGSLYIHETDRRVRLEFPEGCVEKPETLRVTVFPVKVDEMKKRIATFTDHHKFLSVTKVLHVQGCDFTKEVTVHLPLENLVEIHENIDDEYLLFYIEGNEVTLLKTQNMERRGDILVTEVNRFCSYVGVQVPKSKANSVYTMEVLVLANRMYPCKLLTFVDRLSENHVQVWCKVIKKEDYKAHAESHLEENPNQKEISDSVSCDIFIKEQQRLRVDVKGNSFIKNWTSLLITFIPAADGNHITPILSRRLRMGGWSYTTITYQTDSQRKRILNTVSFDPWIIPIPSCNYPRKVDKKKKAEVQRRSRTNVIEEREETREIIEERRADMREIEELRRIEERIKNIERIIQTFGDLTTPRLTENTEKQMMEDVQAQHLISETKRHLYDNFDDFLEKYEIANLREIFFANGITSTRRFMLLEDNHMETVLNLDLGTRIELKDSQRNFLNLE